MIGNICHGSVAFRLQLAVQKPFEHLVLERLDQFPFQFEHFQLRQTTVVIEHCVPFSDKQGNIQHFFPYPCLN